MGRPRSNHTPAQTFKLGMLMAIHRKSAPRRQPPHSRALSRRNMLASAGAVTTGILALRVMSPDVAQAATGDNLVLGDSGNYADRGTTMLSSLASGNGPGVLWVTTGSNPGPSARVGGLVADTNGAVPNAVYGWAPMGNTELRALLERAVPE